ncbi:MAG: hypothetical protein JXJ22_10015 [Bacteroidales bacterium]|nr:hypothetical protein [Bacteroidales bacterium]
MNEFPDFRVDDQWIVTHRGKKNKLDPYKPYAFLIEKEYTVTGSVEDTAVIFLTNSECPFHCLMCDLWKNTTDTPVPVGAIPKQIEWALTNLPPAKHLKLYNSGNFFDAQAIPEQDYGAIAAVVRNFKTVLVENHPKLINEKCLRFRDMLKPDLQIAMGLETVHPKVLLKLNKRMEQNEFLHAVHFLKNNGILSRAFILLNPPFLIDEEGVYWAKKSLDFAFRAGVECCTVIPTRGGNGALEILAQNNFFSPPKIRSLEEVMEYGLQLNAGRVFSDIWDIEKFSDCPECFGLRKNRLLEMNLNQKIVTSVDCSCNTH